MSIPTHEEIAQFVENEQLKAMAEFEVLELERGDVPDRARLPLALMALPFRLGFAILIGLAAGTLALLLNFVIFNMVLHLSMT